MRALACLQPEEALRISKFRFLDDAKLSLVKAVQCASLFPLLHG